MKNILAAFIFLILSVSTAFAQVEKQAEKQAEKQREMIEGQRVEMNKLDQWSGQWKGSGWIQQGAKRETFSGTETVQRKIDGLALLVEGKFSNAEGKVIHETLAVLTYNLKTKIYDFDTFLANGAKGKHDLKATKDGWQWGLQYPGVMMRYDIKLTGSVWLETGEISFDEGKTWMKFFEMKLDRMK